MEVNEDYLGYLCDESRRCGYADSISFPERGADVCSQIAELYSNGTLVTVQSGLTGIAGGAVPDGGHVLNLSHMNRISGMRIDHAGVFCLSVQAGCTLQKLNDLLRSKDFETDGWSAQSLDTLGKYRHSKTGMFPPDLTETTACMGGVAANNGSGARTFRYGSARRHISALTVVLPDGDILKLYRFPQDGYAPVADGRSFSLITESGKVLSGELPHYKMPAVKNAAGFYAADNMPMIDLFIGSEGTLGVITEIEIRLTPVPDMVWGITSFFPNESAALDYVVNVRDEVKAAAAIEFFDARALDLLRRQQSENPAFENLPVLQADWDTAVYVELHSDSEDSIELAVQEISGLMDKCGGDPDATWFAESEREIERFKGVRHAVPEAVNMLIGERKKRIPELTKLGTDLSVPDSELRSVMEMYHRDLKQAGLEYVIFGHIGNNHVHVNILPRKLQDYAEGKRLYLEWAQRVAAMGGSVSAEHGIGKLKTGMLEIMYGGEGIDAMRAVKRVFDEAGLLNRGTLFEWIG